jgi:hypothetical protein
VRFSLASRAASARPCCACRTLMMSSLCTRGACLSCRCLLVCTASALTAQGSVAVCPCGGLVNSCSGFWCSRKRVPVAGRMMCAMGALVGCVCGGVWRRVLLRCVVLRACAPCTQQHAVLAGQGKGHSTAWCCCCSPPGCVLAGCWALARRVAVCAAFVSSAPPPSSSPHTKALAGVVSRRVFS